MPIRVDSPSSSTASRKAAQAGHRRSLGIVLEGPFFEADPVKTYRQNIRALMDRMAQVGAAEARRRAASAPRRTAGPSFSASRIRGRTSSLRGRHRWAVSMVISADTSGLSAAQAIRVQAALAGRHTSVTRGGRHIGTTRGHEGTARVFAGAAGGLRRVIREADLTKGI